MNWTLVAQSACVTTLILTFVGAFGIGLVMAGKAPKWLADSDDKGVENWDKDKAVGRQKR